MSHPDPRHDPQNSYPHDAAPSRKSVAKKMKAHPRSIMGKMEGIKKSAHHLNNMMSSKLSGKEWFEKFGKK